MKKRIFSILLCLAITLSLFSIPSFAASGDDGAVTAKASTTSVKVGDTFTVSVDLKNISGEPYGGIGFKLDLSDGLEYVSSAIGNLDAYKIKEFSDINNLFSATMSDTDETKDLHLVTFTLKAKNSNIGANTVSFSDFTVGDQFGEGERNYGTIDTVTINTYVAAQNPTTVDGKVTAKASETSVKVGDTFTVSVDLKNISGEPYGGIGFKLHLSDGLEYVSSAIGSLDAYKIKEFSDINNLFSATMSDTDETKDLHLVTFTLKAKNSNIGANTVSFSDFTVGDQFGEGERNYGTIDAVTINTYASTANAATKATVEKTTTTVTVTNVIAGQEYAITANGAGVPTTGWNITGKFSGLTANTEYDVYTRVAATSENPAGAAVKTDVTTDKQSQNTGGGGGGGGATTTTKPTTTTPGGVTITEQQTPLADLPFTDISKNFWAYDAIQSCFSKGYFAGKTATTFEPDSPMTREQMWMVLARVSGEKPANMEEAKQWAVSKGISDGTIPTGNVTREQFVTLIWRVAGSPAATKDLSGFADLNSVSSYAKTAMAWAVETGLISGTTDTTISPEASATRAQIATIIDRYTKNK